MKIMMKNNDLEEISEVTRFQSNKVKYHLIKVYRRCKNLAEHLSKCAEFVFDTETDSLDTLNVNMAGASFSFKKGEAYFVPTNPFTEKD